MCDYSGDGGRQSSAGIFVGGFLLGGIIVGALGWVYAPQVTAVMCFTLLPFCSWLQFYIDLCLSLVNLSRIKSVRFF